MLQNKSTKVFSETSRFFTSSEKGIYRIMELYKSLDLNRLDFGVDHMPVYINIEVPHILI